jgi:sugar phosphate isomerase/epimerase
VTGEFSFNQATAQNWPVPEMIAGCVAAGVTQVGLWREPVLEYGLERTVRAMADAGLGVSTLCRGGFFDRPDWLAENRRAIDEAAALGAPVLVLVSGGLPGGSRDLDAARAHVGEAIGTLTPYAAAEGVRLAIEPLHPMFASDRCVINTLGQALALAEAHPNEAVGVVVDTYHVWWDDRIYDEIARAGDRIASFQIADWTTPLPEGVLTGRALPGEGCIEIGRLWRAVLAAGYAGPVEVEIFNSGLWALPGEEVLERAVRAWSSTVHCG